MTDAPAQTKRLYWVSASPRSAATQLWVDDIVEADDPQEAVLVLLAQVATEPGTWDAIVRATGDGADGTGHVIVEAVAEVGARPVTITQMKRPSMPAS